MQNQVQNTVSWCKPASRNGRAEGKVHAAGSAHREGQDDPLQAARPPDDSRTCVARHDADRRFASGSAARWVAPSERVIERYGVQSDHSRGSGAAGLSTGTASSLSLVVEDIFSLPSRFSAGVLAPFRSDNVGPMIGPSRRLLPSSLFRVSLCLGCVFEPASVGSGDFAVVGFRQ